MKTKPKQNKPKSLSDWDWTTLVAAWRYYEYGTTIASSTFPAEIVRRFFGGDYGHDSCLRIASQFSKTDHRDGEADWDSQCLMECDRTPWCKFYAFCKAYCDGFSTVVLDGNDPATGKRLREEVEAFYCGHTRRWYPKDRYVASPGHEMFCAPEFIKEVRK